VLPAAHVPSLTFLGLSLVSDVGPASAIALTLFKPNPMRGRRGRGGKKEFASGEGGGIGSGGRREVE
jgi:hypothetical protein